MFISLIFASLFYFGLCNWIQIRYLLGNLIKPRKNTFIPFENVKLLAKMRKKTKLQLSIKILGEKKKMIGFMISSPPFKPVVIFSEKLYRSFDNDEMQWVILHESAHYLMLHNLRFIIVQLILFLTWVYLFYWLKTSFIITVLIFIVLSLIYIQLAKIFEYQADIYAAKNMDNPKGMITGNIKMMKANKGFFSNKIIRYLLYIAVPYEERIEIAKRQQNLR